MKNMPVFPAEEPPKEPTREELRESRQDWKIFRMETAQKTLEYLDLVGFQPNQTIAEVLEVHLNEPEPSSASEEATEPDSFEERAARNLRVFLTEEGTFLPTTTIKEAITKLRKIAGTKPQSSEEKEKARQEWKSLRRGVIIRTLKCLDLAAFNPKETVSKIIKENLPAAEQVAPDAEMPLESFAERAAGYLQVMVQEGIISSTMPLENAIATLERVAEVRLPKGPPLGLGEMVHRDEEAYRARFSQDPDLKAEDPSRMYLKLSGVPDQLLDDDAALRDILAMGEETFGNRVLQWETARSALRGLEDLKLPPELTLGGAIIGLWGRQALGKGKNRPEEEKLARELEDLLADGRFSKVLQRGMRISAVIEVLRREVARLPVPENKE